jgi:glucokinase
VGGTKSTAVVANAAGNVLARLPLSTPSDAGPDAMISAFVSLAAGLREEHPQIIGCGVSIGGPLDARTGTIVSPPNLPGWDRVPLRQRLERELKLDVVIEHDAAACLLAEALWGGAAGCTHAIYLTCGTGCGAGVLIDGRVLRGPDGQSPEIGHVRLTPDGPEAFGKRGCVESFCSGTGISRLAVWRNPDRWAEPVSTQDLAHLAHDGDRDAAAVFAEAAMRTGHTCAMLADIFSPQVILLGSLARYLGESWLTAVRQAFAREALPDRAERTHLGAASLGEQLQDLSAVAPCVWRNR